jgi:HSP20 family protein
MTRFQFPVRNLPMPIQELATEMEHIVDRMFPRPTCNDSGCDTAALAYSPAMDVSENETQYVVSLDLPGVQIGDVKLEVHEDRLSISGTRSAANRPEGTQYHREERSFGAFQRTLVLPKNVDSDKVEASYQAGVLEVVVPKIAKAQPRTVEIRTASN